MRLVSVESELNGSAKLLWDADDQAGVEASVFTIPEERPVHANSGHPLAANHGVVCISCQVGCSVGCTFCATGRLGRLRNLTIDEMILQAVEGARLLPTDVPYSVTFSGMGEPLQNLRSVIAAADYLCDSEGFEYASLSTIGLPSGIDRLRIERPQTNLFVSLHAASDEKRREIVRSAACFPVSDVVAAAERYARDASKLVKMSWLLLPGFNDTAADATSLAALLDPEMFLVQVLLWNEVAGLPFRRATGQEATDFVELLASIGLTAYVMESRAREIDGACGQLAGSLASGEPEPLEHPTVRRPPV